LMTISNQTGEEMDEEIIRAAMAGVFDLADVLELVIHALDDGTFAQEQFVGGVEQACAHVLAQFGDEDEALLREELLGECLGDVAAVAKELAEEAANQARDGAAVIDVTRSQAEGQQ